MRLPTIKTIGKEKRIEQNRINYNQYMHNTGIINPAFPDKTTNSGGNVIARKQ